MDVKQMRRVESYESWSGATAVADSHGQPIKRAEVSEQILHRMADDELRRARQMLSTGVSRVVLSISDPTVVARMTGQMTESEKNKITFGE